MPEVSAQIRQAAITCRTQLTESTKMLRKVHFYVNLGVSNNRIDRANCGSCAEYVSRPDTCCGGG